VSGSRLGPILHVVGARPNFMKAAPVVHALEGGPLPQMLIHTGQHYDQRLSEIFFDELRLPEPDLNLGVGSGSHAGQTAALISALEPVLIEARPRAVVVYGDVNSTLATSLVAVKLQVPVAHVEAGLRSFDRTMPEEINRVVTDAVAQVHFVTSPEALAHLAREGVSSERMFFVGNPMIDTLLQVIPRLDPEGARRSLGLEPDYGVVTLHRPSNVDDSEAATRVVEGLHKVAERVPLVIPLHPRGWRRLDTLGLGGHERVLVVEPLGYLEFVSLMAGARLVLTDSGGIQEETTVLGVPCLTLRWNTERPITISHGTNRLVGDEPKLIAEGADHALSRSWEPGRPPLWDGHAGERIGRTLVELFGSG
jgi:UDP-N-acetylglucosamine 2-epimerase (non-hydrolysing)